MKQARKKLLFVITKATRGGAQKYVYDLAVSLPKEGFEPIVAYGTPGGLVDTLRKAGVATRRIPSLARDIALVSDVKSVFEILAVIREIRPDVIHLNSSKAAALGACAARIMGVPRIIFTAHGWPFKENRNLFVRALIYATSWFTTLLSHAVVVVSQEDAVRGRNMVAVGRKIHHIPIGIEPPVLLSRDEASATLAITQDTPRVVTVAELTPNKGIRYAIEAISELKKRNMHVSYFIIGEGEEREELEHHARKLEVADRVHFLGFIPEAAVYLKAFDAFLLPSLKEGMPYVLLEAASAGLPIIATDAVDATANVRVPSGDANALAEAIIKIQGRREAATIPSTLQDMVKSTVALY